MEEESKRTVSGWTVSSLTPKAPSVKDQKEEAAPQPEKGFRLSVLGVQSLACGVFLLLALLLRVTGGNAYTQLRSRFHESLMANEVLAALAGLWDGEEELSSPEPPLPDQTATGRMPPKGAMAVCLRANRPAAVPVIGGLLTSGYGYRDNPTGPGEQFHRGADIAAPEGRPIAALFDGRVEEVGESPSLGNFVRLVHGRDLEVLYAHCRAVAAPEGAVVRAGETVGYVGHTGDATGNHVHIQVSRQGTVYNPAELLRWYYV